MNGHLTVELEIVCGITVATDGTTVPHSHWILCLFCTFLGASNQARRGAESEGIMQPLDRAVCTGTIQTRLLVATALAARICCSKQTMCTQQMCTQIRKKLHKHRQACDYCTYRPIFFRQAIWMGKNEMAIGMRPVGTHLYFWVFQTNWDYFPSVKSYSVIPHSRICSLTSTLWNICLVPSWLTSIWHLLFQYKVSRSLTVCVCAVRWKAVALSSITFENAWKMSSPKGSEKKKEKIGKHVNIYSVRTMSVQPWRASARRANWLLLTDGRKSQKSPTLSWKLKKSITENWNNGRTIYFKNG